MKRERMDFMIDEEDNKELARISYEEGVSKAWLIRRAIKDYIISRRNK